MKNRRVCLVRCEASVLAVLAVLTVFTSWSTPAVAARNAPRAAGPKIGAEAQPSLPAKPVEPASQGPIDEVRPKAGAVERGSATPKKSTQAAAPVQDPVKSAKVDQAARAAANQRAAEAAARRDALAARLQKLGPMSVGLPNTGFLVNGLQMPQGEDWVLTVPSHGFGTEETVRQLSQCISATRGEFPESPRVMLGSLSAQHGGKLLPHKSHRSGRDADVYFFRQPGAKWNEAASEDDIDLPRTWALLRCFVTKADVDMVLIDRKVQGWLERYALSIGEPPEWVNELFHDQPHTKSAIVRHVPGHVAHMHVRFVSAHARRLGARHYQELVNAGLLQERVEEVRHTVQKGDTLLGLAKRYKTSVEEISSLNRLKGTIIRLGQALLMKQGRPIEGIEAPIYARGRSLPPEPCEPGPKACHAGLALVHPGSVGAFVGEAPPDSSPISASLR